MLQLPEPKPSGRTEDGRDIYTFSIAGVIYQVRDPLAEEIKQKEIEISKRYVQYAREGGIPEGWEIDHKFAVVMAAIISPKLTVDQLRKAGRKVHYALLTALDRTIKINEVEDIDFFPKSSRPVSVLPNERDGVVVHPSPISNQEATTLPHQRSPILPPPREAPPRKPRRPSRVISGSTDG